MPTALIRLIATLTVGLAGVSAALAQLPPPPPETAPQAGKLGLLRFETEMHDFGDIWDHEKVSYAYQFVNAGSEDLTITDVNASCGCTVPELDKRVYAPGETGEIVVEFNPANRQGKQSKSVRITTDSRRTPTVTISFTSNVTKVLDMDPGLANLGRIFKGEEKGMKVHIIGSMPDFKAWLAEEQPDLGLFKAEVVQSDEAEIDDVNRPRTTIRVWVDESMMVGRHTGEIILKTNDERRPEVSLRAIVTVVGDLQGRPPRFALGRLQPGESYERTVTVLNRVAEDFKVTRIEALDMLGDVEVSHAPTVDGKHDAYDITVRGVAPGPNERILGRIVVHTDMKSEPTIELPIYGFVNQFSPAAAGGAEAPEPAGG